MYMILLINVIANELEECKRKELVIKAIIEVTIADVEVAGVGVSLGTLTPEAAHSVDTAAILTQARHQLALINVWNKQH